MINAVRVCQRCAVFKPVEQVTFHLMEEVVDHLVACHPNRLPDLVSALFAAGDHRLDVDVEQYIDHALRDHNAEVKK